MTPAQAAAALDRLAGEFEHEFTDDERRVWLDALLTYSETTAYSAIARLMGDHMDLPSVAEFRAACREAGVPLDKPCSCLNGWEMPTPENWVTACGACYEGRVRAELSEQYRKERAAQRRRLRGPALLKEKPATADEVSGWLAQARAFQAGEALVPAPPTEDDYF